MHDVMPSLEAWLAEGEQIAIATVVQTWGSAPRPIGSKMLVTHSGRIVGSVSGGCVESAVVDASEEVFRSERPNLLSFGVADEEAWQVGLACGGSIQVFLEPFSALEPVYNTLKDSLSARQPIVLVSVIEGADDLINRKLLVAKDGILQGNLRLLDSEPKVVQMALDCLTANVSRMNQIEPGLSLFFECLSPTLRLIVIGAVHFAQTLVSIANILGFETIVVDPRSAFATSERFPQATRLVPAWPQHVLPELGLEKNDFIVVLSHDPKIDDPALENALQSSAGYVGALGSQHTHQERLNRLREKGVSEKQLERIHAPVGLPLGGYSAGEVAISIMADILIHKNEVEFYYPPVMASSPDNKT